MLQAKEFCNWLLFIHVSGRRRTGHARQRVPNLSGADLTGADLHKADLFDTAISETQHVIQARSQLPV